LQDLDRKLDLIERWIRAVRANDRPAADSAMGEARTLLPDGGGDPFGWVFKWLTHAQIFIWGDTSTTVCTFCGRHSDNPLVDKLVAGPLVFICSGCVDLATVAETTGGLAVRFPPCAFCNQRERAAFGKAEALICVTCLETCRDIIRDDRGQSAPQE
jgi:hypothetical protein